MASHPLRSLVKAVVPIRLRQGMRTAMVRAQYYGSRYRCPICNADLKTMLPFGQDLPVLREKRVVGGGYRAEARCPVCGSNDRERLVYLYLKHKTNIFDRVAKLLHVAPEGALQPILSRLRNVEYLTADLDDPDVMVTMDITKIQYPDESFDAIICNHVLEHIPDDGTAMSELHRVLKPGGWAVLQVPMSLSLQETEEDFSVTTNAGRLAAYGQDDHVRIYAKDYRDRLARAGFLVQIFDWATDAAQFGGSNNRFALNPEERVYVGEKAAV